MPLAWVWGVRVGRSPTPDRPSFGRAAGARYPLDVGAGDVLVGTRHQPDSARSCELVLRVVGRHEGARGGGVPLAWVWGVWGWALSHARPRILGGGCGMQAWRPGFLGCFFRAALRRVLCALCGFAAPCGRCCLAPVRVPWLWPAVCLSGVPPGPAWCTAPRLVRSTLVLRSAFPTPWCLTPPRGLAPLTLLGDCAGHAEAGELGSLRVVPVRCPAMGLSLTGPSGIGLGLRALRWLACVDLVTDASGFPYRPSSDGGLGRCTGAVSCGRRHLPLQVGGRHTRVRCMCACAGSSWPGRGGRPPGCVLVRRTFPLAAVAFLFARPPLGWGCPFLLVGLPSRAFSFLCLRLHPRCFSLSFGFWPRVSRALALVPPSPPPWFFFLFSFFFVVVFPRPSWVGVCFCCSACPPSPPPSVPFFLLLFSRPSCRRRLLGLVLFSFGPRFPLPPPPPPFSFPSRLLGLVFVSCRPPFPLPAPPPSPFFLPSWFSSLSAWFGVCLRWPSLPLVPPLSPGACLPPCAVLCCRAGLSVRLVFCGAVWCFAVSCCRVLRCMSCCGVSPCLVVGRPGFSCVLLCCAVLFVVAVSRAASLVVSSRCVARVVACCLALVCAVVCLCRVPGCCAAPCCCVLLRPALCCCALCCVFSPCLVLPHVVLCP